MTRLLLVLASPAPGDQAWSTRAAHVLAARLTAGGDSEIAVRDLGADPPPHLGLVMAQALQTPAADRTSEHAATLAPGRTFAAEIAAADQIIIATPIINAGPPSQLKAWFDHMLTPTARVWTEDALPPYDFAGRKVFVIEARVPISGASGQGEADFLMPYLQSVLGQLGFAEIESVTIDCLTQDPEAALKAFDASLRDIGRRFP